MPTKVHVNHLNRAIKETTEKTTSQLIAERFLQEAKVLLKHSAWSVSEIAYALGFTEVSHFNNFFKKHVQTSPTEVLLSLPMLQPDQVTDSLHAYQLSKRGNSLRVMAEADLQQMNIARRNVTPNDVEIDILYCGVCHSDLHTARNDWGGTVYPAVPGHEIVGRVTNIGNEVTKFKVGDLVGVGCLVDSCQTCSSCKQEVRLR